MADALPPAAESLVLGPTGGVVLTADGEIEALDAEALRRRLGGAPALLCHGRAAARRCGLDRVVAFDLLELFAFVRPARFARPTPRGLAEATGLPMPATAEDAAIAQPRIAAALLAELAALPDEERLEAAATAAAMTGWGWRDTVLGALGFGAEDDVGRRRRALDIWTRLPEWQAEGPPPPPGQRPVEPAEARRRLTRMLGDAAEVRQPQSDYASAASAAFAPRPDEDGPIVVLAEAGTGTGKTLGYLAPATLWAERNGAPVWISTFTRNLQHQIDGELSRLHPDPAEKARRVVIRKGRENYLCLLNYEEAVRSLPLQPHYAAPLGLTARWIARSRDGDMTGGDFPGWLADVAGRGATLGLADRRGECIHSACPHYGRCFVERSIRHARGADIVIANHALVMVQAALGGIDDRDLPLRYVFDEGHHLFDAADSAFAGHLTGLEAAELRRWLLGIENGAGRGRSSRARGLRRRIEDLLPDADGAAALDAIERAARALPGPGWTVRLAEGQPRGQTEAFLALVRRQVHARAPGADGPYALEAAPDDPIEGLADTAAALATALAALQAPIAAVAAALRRRLDDASETLDSQERQRLDAAARALERRGRVEIGGWRAMLSGLGGPTPPDFVDWFGVDRIDGREIDAGYYRHWVDPTIPFAAAVAGPAHGILVTSATLTDGSGDQGEDWLAAEMRTGAAHLPRPAIRARVPSPFDYRVQTRILVVRDVRKDDLEQVAAAYRALFLAAGGGALGLFTAVTRLRAVHGLIAPALRAAGLPLYAQHVDGMDVGTLVDIFRGEADACLLGTDAVRDGVDVPGRALRLMVFDRVPWPRPDALFRARCERFGRARWTDLSTRLRLKQAFGRLVRRADDQGVFVLLDPMMPTRLCGAFPPGVEVVRTGLAEAVAVTRDFLAAK
jgi:ATP-dependent DNA helicase DinG